MSREDMMKVAGIKLEDTMPKKNDNKERIEELENAIIELAEMLVEVQNNG